MKKWKAGKKQNFGKTNSSDLTSSGSRIVKETIFTGNTKSYTLVYLYDEYGSPIGFRYRTLSYSANVFDGYFFEKKGLFKNLIRH